MLPSENRGFNPLRWDCAGSGCFNKKRRPKIEVFSDCFPGRINFGDVDGMVEINRYFCLLEWKGSGGRLQIGQQMAYTKFTETEGYVVFIVEGDAESMVVRRYQRFWMAKQHDWVDGDLDMLKQCICRWVARARVADWMGAAP